MRESDIRCARSAGIAPPAPLSIARLSVAMFRISQRAGSLWGPLGMVVKQLNHLVTGADIAWQATIAPGLVLYHPTGVVVGAGVVIGRNCVLQSCVTLGGRGSQKMPRIGDKVLIGAGARVLGEIEIHDNVRIGANAVVTRDVPEGAVAVGIPARVVSRTD